MNFVYIFMICAIGYGAIEILWRNKTHWTMILCGGISGNAIIAITRILSDFDTIFQSIISGLAITLVELSAGIILNIKQGKKIWDYSSLAFNYKGQICLRYSIYWVIISYFLINIYNISLLTVKI